MGVAGSAHRPPGKEHIPLYPKGFIAIRFVQFAMALVVLCLSAIGGFQANFNINKTIAALPGIGVAGVLHSPSPHHSLTPMLYRDF
ncbi:hypothetical protein VTJ04DRAFT_10556 [Mycothermus thermophilus]|uniref:uncharacterized protein n=1 Tax=Humicola insolens TaxID=85995 RepID=UPI0037421062